MAESLNIQSLTKLAIDALVRKSPEMLTAIGYHTTHRKNKDSDAHRRLSLKNNPFLYDIYNSDAQKIIIRKGVQVLQTETFIIKKVILPCARGQNVLYMLPTLNIARLFVRERIDKLFSRTDYYRHLVSMSSMQTSNTIMKNIGGGTAMFVGAGQETYVEGFPMDVIVYDEYDSLIRQNGQNIVDQAEDREKGADAPNVTKLGNPYAADVMIDGEYQTGDMRQWMVKCSRCGCWQELDWFIGYVRKLDPYQYEPIISPDSLPQSTDIPYTCMRCKLPMDRFSPMSEWVAQYPERRAESYTISRMMINIPGRPVARDMHEEFFDKAVKDSGKMQAFYRSNLGIGYEASGENAISEDLVLSCVGDYQQTTSSLGVCLVGGDIKTQWWHYVVGRIEDDYSITVLYIGKDMHTKAFKKIALSGGFKVRLAVLDSQGMGGRIIREQLLSDERLYPIIWSAFYRQVERVHQAKRVVHCIRDILIDDVMSAMRNHDIRFPSSAAQNREFLRHMTANVKVPIESRRESEKDTVMFSWKRRAHRYDDYLHAVGYLIKARDVLVEMYGMLPPSHEQVPGDIMDDVDLFP